MILGCRVVVRPCILNPIAPRGDVSPLAHEAICHATLLAAAPLRFAEVRPRLPHIGAAVAAFRNPKLEAKTGILVFAILE
jgi:hypothetical protein